MLFAIKRRLVPTLALLAIFVIAALCLRSALGLTWPLEWGTAQLRDLLVAAGVIAVSDAGIHGLLTATLGDRYRTRYQALAEYFRSQRAPEMIAGGLLAGGEELIFRGVLLEALQCLAGLSSAAAVVLTAAVFGFCHVIPSRPLAPFALWAVWEGAL